MASVRQRRAIFRRYKFLQVVVPDESALTDFHSAQLSIVDELIKRAATEAGGAQSFADGQCQARCGERICFVHSNARGFCPQWWAITSMNALRRKTSIRGA